MHPPIILDLSRLLSRVLNATPTGVDRVEMAYARGLLAAAPERIGFAAVHPGGVYGRLPRAAVETFLDRTERHWERGGSVDRWALGRQAVASLAALRPRRMTARSGMPPVYIQASPHHLNKPALVAAILRRERAAFLALVHDLIPLEFPEYAREGGAAQHRVRVETVARHAAVVLANSRSTLDAMRPYIAAAGRDPVTAVVHLGTHTWGAAAGSAAPTRPYFVCLGTIEPRKNHLLLLKLWRRLAEETAPADLPQLVVVGRRGWENEQVVDMLERCPALTGCVVEHSGLPDGQLRPLLAGARALLLPSFAEGYGMPVTEALDLGVPVICSDLPALREAGGAVPDYLDPLDGPAWRQAILDYAALQSPRRAAQLTRLAVWEAPTWRKHIDTLLGLVEKAAA